MTPEDIDLIRQVLPDETPLPYYADRESPWLLAQMIHGRVPVRALKAGGMAGLLSRPAVRPVVAASGGAIAQSDVLTVAHADRAHRMEGLGGAARAGLNAVYGLAWKDYVVSFAAWGAGRLPYHAQMSRKGGNLVLQLGFPSDHAVILGQTNPRAKRSDYEFTGHPIQEDGRPTLAWVRMDIDLAEGVALIEEVQSDWLRWAVEDAQYFERQDPRSRQAKTLARYTARLTRAYAKAWPNVALFAALSLLVDELGVRRIWMHQPAVGAVLKSIKGTHPPRSLYTSLPRRFGFQPTRVPPPFLVKPCRRALARIKHFKTPLFWVLDLSKPLGGF